MTHARTFTIDGTEGLSRTEVLTAARLCAPALSVRTIESRLNRGARSLRELTAPPLSRAEVASRSGWHHRLKLPGSRYHRRIER